MIVIKNKIQLERCVKYGLNPNKRLQFIKTYSKTSHYFNAIKENFALLGSLLITFISMPFLILWQLILCLKGFNFWCLIYIKKEIKDDPLVVNATFKNPKDVELDFDKQEDVF